MGKIFLPKVSVLVLNYNGIEFLGDCLRSLEKLRYPNYEVVLIDNASSDSSVEYARHNFPWVKLLVHKSNYGFCEGYNRIVEYAEGDYLAFLNNDTVVSPNWLIELVTAAHKYQVDICGSKIFLGNEPHLINHIGAKITPIGSGYDLKFGTKDSESNTRKPVFTAAACGAAMLIKKETFLKLGGFDPDYFAYSEDLDLCWRAWLQGYRVMCIPSSVIYHKFGGSWGGTRTYSRTFLGQKNRLANMLKNFELVNVLRGLVISLGYDMIRIFMFIVTGEFRNVIALAYGTLYFIKQFPHIMRKRKAVQCSRLVSDRQLSQLGLIASLGECIKEWIKLERMEEFK